MPIVKNIGVDRGDFVNGDGAGDGAMSISQSSCYISAIISKISKEV